jgi:hypothetical protein
MTPLRNFSGQICLPFMHFPQPPATATIEPAEPLNQTGLAPSTRSPFQRQNNKKLRCAATFATAGMRVCMKGNAMSPDRGSRQT